MNTKIKYTVIAILISITSFAQIDAELQPYYNSFLSDATYRGVALDLSYSLEMKFINDNRHVYSGISIIDANNKKAIVAIKQSAWDPLTIIDKKIMVYHELGHALLYRMHQEHNLSIMNSIAVTEAVYLANENDLLNELFKPYGNTNSHFKCPLGNSLDPIEFTTGDLVFFTKGFGYPLKPFLVNIGDYNNEIYTLGDYQLWVASVIDLSDRYKMVTNGDKVIQIRSTHSGLSLIQTNPLYQPLWNSYTNKLYFPTNTYLEYNFEALNTSFEPSLLGFSGQVKITDDMNKWTGKIIVLFYEKPYMQNYE